MPQSNYLKAAVLVAVCGPTAVWSSPWLEPDDAFLRSSLVLLSDAGQLSSPVNHFPLRWSLFADDLVFLGNNTDFVAIANQELSHYVNNAKRNRGHRRVALLASSRAAAPHGYGQFNEDQKGLYSRYESLNDGYAYRISAAYREYQDDTEFSWENSYLAFNNGPWLWSIGDLNRWWGPGWQHNLSLGSYAKAAPDMSLSYLGVNDRLGVWSIETLLATPKNPVVDYHSATRLVSKPWSTFEYGLTYQAWFADGELSATGPVVRTSQRSHTDQQVSVDAKWTLPALGNLYHSVYAQAASTARTTELGVYLLGWSGAMPVGENTLRLVLESQQASNAYSTTPWRSGRYPSLTDKVANTSYTLGDSASVAVYLQRYNDHKFGASYQSSENDGLRRDVQQLTYRFPALNGMVHLGVSQEKDDSKTQDRQTRALWSGYEFRF